MSFGEVAAARAAGQVAYWAIADLTYTFSGPVVQILYNNFDDKTDNKEFKDYLKSGWDGIGYVFLAKSAADITGLTAMATKKQIARGYAAIKTYGEDEFYEMFEQSLREASKDLAEEQIKAISKDLKNNINELNKEIPDLIQEELETARKLLNGTGNFKDLLKSNIVAKLGSDAKYNSIKNWINDLDDVEILNRLENLSLIVDDNGISDISKLGDDYDKLIDSGIDFNDFEILSSWSSLSRSPIIRTKPENLKILKKVHTRFEYDNLSSFDGLNKLLNEGSSASKQKLIDGLNQVNNIFDPSLPIKFSGIKAGDVKVIASIDGKGDEVARYVDGILQKKKNLDDGEIVGNYEGDDILRNGDEVGFKAINSVGEDLTEIIKKRKDFWDNLRQQYFPDNDWSKTDFITEGIDFNTFKSNNPSIYDEMVSKYDSPDFADNFLPDLIKSGNEVPKRIELKAGDKLYKIVAKGQDIQSPSAYYLSKSELDFVKNNPEKLEQVLGLPLSSNAAQYDVFTITARTNVTVFESTIAPTKQFSKANPSSIYKTTGGRKQTLVIDNRNKNLWDKGEVPVESISPRNLPEID